MDKQTAKEKAIIIEPNGSKFFPSTRNMPGIEDTLSINKTPKTKQIFSF